MQRFLEQCAEYVYRTRSENFQSVCLVFPNRRAGLFFSSYLKKLLSKPVIGPATTTINEWMLSFSPLLPAGQLRLLSHLYAAYREVTGSRETFDDFYFWGEILLADFDDIDKYLVDAKALFTNLSDVREIESHFDFLSDGQKRYLEQFWGTLRQWEQYEHETDFVTYWQKLFGVYSRFRERLSNERSGYPGMIMRDGVENGMNDLSRDSKSYVFIGLNALNRCEQSVFTRLREERRAEFLWDFDDFYIGEPANPAGKFLRDNLDNFPPPKGFHPDTDNFRKPKKITLVAVSSPSGQSQEVPRFVSETGVIEASGHDSTAIVLADESLLFPVLGAIPENAGSVNVTMGYPVNNSPIVSLLQSLASMARHTLAANRQDDLIYHRWVSGILSHPLVKSFESEKAEAILAEIRSNNTIYVHPADLYISDFHRLLFTLPSKVADYSPWFLAILDSLYGKLEKNSATAMVRELIYHVHSELRKVEAMVQETLALPDFDISPQVYFRLVMQHLNRLSVPFAGEPLTGLQVMGILETRCLDFDNVLIIGLNEDNWPRTSVAPSIIPFNLRKAFGLPGIDDQDAMYTYYFYRLLGRATKITATWNTVREATSGGELSRYGFQLLLNSPHKVIRSHRDFIFQSNPVLPLSVSSDASISQRLLDLNLSGKPLSPSAINMFLTCRLKFYFRYAVGLQEPDEVKEDIDRQVFGNIFHKAVELLYAPLIGHEVTEERVERLLQDANSINKAVLRAFALEYFHRPDDDLNSLSLEGKSILIYSTLVSYLKSLLENDLKRAPFFLHSLESWETAAIDVNIDGIVRRIVVGGKVDRIEEKEGVVSVIDYKTGSVQPGDLTCSSLEELFDQSKKEVKKEIIQALVYKMALRRTRFPDKVIRAEIFSVVNLNKPSFNGEVRVATGIDSTESEEDLFAAAIKERLAEIYSASTLFSQTDKADRCRICPYRLICRR